MDYTKYIDSVVGNIARKIEDEFNEKDHPRDKGGKFTSKGGEGKGGAKEEPSIKAKNSTKLPWDGSEEETAKLAKKYGVSYKLVSGPGKDPHQHIQLTGDPAKIKKFVVNEGFGGDKEEAKEWVPELFGETETEKAAREELGEKEDINELIDLAAEYAEDEESAHELLEKLGWDHEGIDTKSGLKAAIKSAVRRDPKTAYEILGKEMQGVNPDIDLEETEDPHDFPGKVVNWGRAGDVIEEFEASGIDLDAAATDLGIELQGDDDRWKLGDLEKKIAYNEKLLKKAEEYIKRYRSGN